MSEWQPIEKAPHYKGILLFHKHGYAIGFYADLYKGWYSHSSGFIKPTHWMELPPAPENKN